MGEVKQRAPRPVPVLLRQYWDPLQNEESQDTKQPTGQTM